MTTSPLAVSSMQNHALGSLHISRVDVANLALLLDGVGAALSSDPMAARDYLTHAGGMVANMLGEQVMPWAPAEGGLAPWQIRRLRAHVDDHLHEKVPVGELSHMVRLSCSYFSRAFKVSFGCSPHSYVLLRRIARAKLLLQGGDDSVAQIALSCGFSDQAHLSRVFRRHIGCTPSSWRRNTRQSGLRQSETLAEDRSRLRNKAIPPTLSRGNADRGDHAPLYRTMATGGARLANSGLS